MKELKKILREHRKARKLTLKQLGERLDIPWTTIGSWELGRSRPVGENREKVAKFYKMADEEFGPDMRGRPVEQRPSEDYPTKPIMLHNDQWAFLEELRPVFGVPDKSQVIDHLLREYKRSMSLNGQK